MTTLIPVLGMMSVNIFFATSAFIGYQYNGIENSKIYILYCITIAILNIFICIKSISKDYKVNQGECVLLLFPFLAMFFYCIGIMQTGYININSIKFFMYFILWCVPAIYGGIYVCRKKILYSLIKWIDVIIIIYSLAIIFTTIIPFAKGVGFDSIGGGTYQNASYIAANAYGIGLYFIFYGKYYDRFNFTKMSIYKYIYMVLISIQILGIFISGGRGGIVLTFVYTIVISSIVIISRNKKNISIYVFFISILTIIGFLVLPKLMENDIFLSGFKRVFAFISHEGSINWDGTSNRNYVYLDAINLILQKPIVGYGVFEYLTITPNPHNLILEILLAGGVIYLITSIIIVLGIVIKLINLIKSDKRNLILLVLILYPLTMLMFSGTYLNCSEFWFTITCIVLYPLNTNKDNTVSVVIE